MEEKVALFEIGTSKILLTLAKVTEGENFLIYKTLGENVYINENIENDGLIKAPKIQECVTMLAMYKKICEAEGVTKYIGFASSNIVQAKNYKSFISEAENAIGFDFTILSGDDEVSAIYTAVINTLDVPKGIIVNISSYSTRIIHYNRRIVIDSVTIPMGSMSLLQRAENMPLIAIDIFKKELAAVAAFFQNVEPETNIVGVGDVFVSVSRLARKIKRYPMDIDHNYNLDMDAFAQVFEFIKSLDSDKRQKLKGIAPSSGQMLLGGMCIMDAICRYSGLKNLVISRSPRSIGILFKNALPFTQERPVADVLSYSLGVAASAAGLDIPLCDQTYTYSLLLFKQLRVLHKLPRAYTKILRIASYLYHIGKKINCENFERYNYNAILGCAINGASHKEILLSAFAASIRKWEDFNPMEWMKYKDIVSDDEVDAVRKIAIIIAMADTLNIRRQNIVKDVSSDILGDSVILKLICETDPKAPKVDVKAAETEIFYAKKFAGDFVRAFKKNLEIL